MTVSTRYDCIVVGGGVSGTALLYQLARFTNLKHLLLAEKSNRPAQANSHACNNSQTLRHGDIESERKLDQALAVKRSTSMLINYASKRPAHERDQILHRMPRMLLGIGERECDSIRQRYQTFRHAYPDMQLFDRQDIADIEPNVALVDGTWRHDQILALGTRTPTPRWTSRHCRNPSPANVCAWIGTPSAMQTSKSLNFTAPRYRVFANKPATMF